MKNGVKFVLFAVYALVVTPPARADLIFDYPEVKYMCSEVADPASSLYLRTIFSLKEEEIANMRSLTDVTLQFVDSGYPAEFLAGILKNGGLVQTANGVQKVSLILATMRIVEATMLAETATDAGKFDRLADVLGKIVEEAQDSIHLPFYQESAKHVHASVEQLKKIEQNFLAFMDPDGKINPTDLHYQLAKTNEELKVNLALFVELRKKYDASVVEMTQEYLTYNRELLRLLMVFKEIHEMHPSMATGSVSFEVTLQKIETFVALIRQGYKNFLTRWMPYMPTQLGGRSGRVSLRIARLKEKVPELVELDEKINVTLGELGLEDQNLKLLRDQQI